MPGVPRELAEHRLRVDPKIKPVKEYLHRSTTEKREAIGEEVARLLAAEFIREIYHSEWLANVIMVPKKDDSLRMCIDFKHINRACPKDHFLYPASTRLSTQLRDVSDCPSWTHIPGTIKSDCLDPTRSKQLSSPHSGVFIMLPCPLASRMLVPHSCA